MQLHPSTRLPPPVTDTPSPRALQFPRKSTLLAGSYTLLCLKVRGMLQAWRDIERAYGKSVRASFATISPEPVASASLGQVYRGVLVDALGGGEVAVKVQRPHILSAVALDLYLMRWAAILSRRLPQAWALLCMQLLCGMATPCQQLAL